MYSCSEHFFAVNLCVYVCVGGAQCHYLLYMSTENVKPIASYIKNKRTYEACLENVVFLGCLFCLCKVIATKAWCFANSQKQVKSSWNLAFFTQNVVFNIAMDIIAHMWTDTPLGYLLGSEMSLRKFADSAMWHIDNGQASTFFN